MSEAGHQFAQDSRLRIADAIDALYRHKWIVIACLLLFPSLALVYVMGQEPLYRATSFIMVELSATPGRSASSRQGQMVDEDLFSRNDRGMADELFVLQSSSELAERVAQRLLDLPVLAGGDPSRSLLYGPDSTKRTAAQLGSALRFVVSFAPVEGTASLISVTAVGGLPDEVLAIANIYADEYVKLTAEAGRTSLTSSRSFLEGQLTERQQELRQAEERVNGYLRDQNTVGLDQAAQSLVSSIATLEAQRDEATDELETRRISLETIHENMKELRPQLVQQIAQGLDRRIDEVHKKIGTLQAAREQIELRYPDQAQRTPTTRTELDQIAKQIADLEAEATQLSEQFVSESAIGGATDLSVLSGLRSQELEERLAIRSLEAKIGMLDRRLVLQQNELRAIPRQSIELAQLERARVYAEQMHQLVAAKLLDTHLTGEMSRVNSYVRIIRKAESAFPLPTDGLRMVLIGALAGLLLGGVLVMIREKIDNRIHKIEQLRLNGYRDLGVVPDMRRLIREDFSGKATVKWEGRDVSSSLVVLLSPHSAAAEAYRHAYVDLLFGRPDASTRLILITSPGPGEGKSCTAANMAVAIAQSGRRTLLIDADLRRPVLHRMFDVDGATGLRHLLAGNADPRSKIVATGIEGCYLLPAGRLPHEEASWGNGSEDASRHPVDLFASKRAQELIYRLKEQFDTIIIDTPPVLAGPEATLLAPRCDATVVVVRAGQTREEELEQAAESILESGTEPRILLNGFALSMAYGYRYKYRHYSKYGWYSKYGYSGYNGGPSSRQTERRKKSASQAS